MQSIKEHNGSNELFLKAFSMAKAVNDKLLLTRRQYRRWRQGRGQAFAYRNQAMLEMPARSA